MCSLQLVKFGNNKISLDTFSVHKVQLGLQRYPLISSKLHGSLRSGFLLQSDWSIELWRRLHGHVPMDALCRRSSLKVFASFSSKDVVAALTQFATAAATRFKIFSILTQNQLFLQCGPPIGITVFGLWGLLPFCRFARRFFFKKEDRQWRESQTRNIVTSYLRPLFLWTGVMLICRAFDPLVLATEASQAIKQRFLNFVRSLSTVLAFAYCSSSLSQQLQKVIQDKQGGAHDTRSVGAEFIGNTVYTAVWIGALCLFMELLGFSTQKWLTAGGLGTVLLTLAGREIFTNFLSGIMIHATRPFIVNEWIQTKIEGYEVSGTVEHVGWWSPTIVRGDDREAVHIPNHKFTVSVVRNLSQKSHWRIKTHLGISHLDASKITSIVADMRKVLSKHPQVEQRRLHRRVFLESIDPENQALMVLISCFVKTPHFEEYLRVKEAILLDLLKVISHHHARLATPIRSVQRLLDETDSRNSPFRDMSRSSEPYGRPYLLIEASAVANGRDADQSSSVTTQTKGTESVSSHSKLQLEGLDTMGLNSNDITLLGAAFEKPPANIPESNDVSDIETRNKMVSKSKVQDSTAGVGKSSIVIELTGAEPSACKSALEPQRASSVSDSLVGSEEKNTTESQSDAALQTQAKAEGELIIDPKRVQVHGTLSVPPARPSTGLSSSKQETDRVTANLLSTNKPQVEENLVLGVALDGPKRTLPLDDEIPFSSEKKELVSSRNGNSGTAIKEMWEGTEGSQSSGTGSIESLER